VALSGTQWHSVALSGTQWHSVALSGTQWHSVALSGTQWHSACTQWHSVALSMHAVALSRRVERIVARLLDTACVDDHGDVVDGQRGLRHVGRQNDLALRGRRPLKDFALLLRGELAVQRQQQPACGVRAACKVLLEPAYLGDTWKEDQYRAAPKAAHATTTTATATTTTTLGARGQGALLLRRVIIDLREERRDELRGYLAISGNQWSSAVISGHQRSSAVISGHQRSSAVICGHQRSSAVISGHLRSSAVICGHQQRRGYLAGG